VRSRLLAAAGVAASALVVGTALTTGYGLTTGFERAAETADLPDVLARFTERDRNDVDQRVGSLPNLAARSYRYEETEIGLRASGHRTPEGVVHVVLGGRRGYAVTQGRDLSDRPGEVLVEQGLAREWDLKVGQPLSVGGLGRLRVTGVVLSPDNVAFPLARTARVYVGEDEVEAAFPGAVVEPNVALLWLADRERVDITLAQARAVSFGVGRLRFITRAGIAVLLEQAAGVVIALLAAFSLVALIAAGTMLGASAHADVQRQLPGIGVRRALGFRVADVVRLHAGRAALTAAPAAAAGLGIGALIAAGPTGDLLSALNEQPPGAALLAPLAIAWLAIVALTAAAAAWPAWRAARTTPARMLRGGEMSRAPKHATGGGFLRTGARFATAGRARFAGSTLTLAVCGGVVLLMLALASLLVRLRDDPLIVGKRYAFTVRADPFLIPSIEAIPGVSDTAARYAVDAADSFRLDEPLRLIAFDGDHVPFEAPPLESGRRVRRDGEVEVGRGLADILGLRPGSRLSVQLANGAELRMTVTGIVRALERDGRQAWLRSGTLLAADPSVSPALAIKLKKGASRTDVAAQLGELDVKPIAAGGATTRDAGFLGILAAVLRGVALAVGLVCLYALAQGLAMTARERRGAMALLRAVGAGRREIALVLGGAAAAVAVPAAAGAIVLGEFAFAPLVAHLAADYAGLPLGASLAQAAAVVAGLLALAALSAALVARRVMREPVVAGLREE
jgi:ABC-type lipoprotein release transport system permease subunit